MPTTAALFFLGLSTTAFLLSAFLLPGSVGLTYDRGSGYPTREACWRSTCAAPNRPRGCDLGFQSSWSYRSEDRVCDHYGSAWYPKCADGFWAKGCCVCTSVGKISVDHSTFLSPEAAQRRLQRRRSARTSATYRVNAWLSRDDGQFSGSGAASSRRLARNPEDRRGRRRVVECEL